MFKEQLKENLAAIFGFRRVSFNAPSEVYEQDTLFIEIKNVLSRTSSGMAYARIDGELVVYSQAEKLPYGHFNKRVEKADPVLTRPFFFHDFDTDIASSPARMMNLSERRTKFVFLYSGQYDPRQGSLTELDLHQTLVVESGDSDLIDVGGGDTIEGEVSE